MSNNQKKNKTSKKKIWFKDVKPKNKNPKSNSEKSEEKTENKIKTQTNSPKNKLNKKPIEKKQESQDDLLQSAKEDSTMEDNNADNSNQNEAHSNKINDNTLHNKRKNKNKKIAASFRQQLVNHIDEFVQIVTTSCNQGCFEGILCKVETNFIILIDNLLIIEIPINKIAAIIRYAGGTPPNEIDSPPNSTDIYKKINNIEADNDITFEIEEIIDDEKNDKADNTDEE